jgi:hypothetical protein
MNSASTLNGLNATQLGDYETGSTDQLRSFIIIYNYLSAFFSPSPHVTLISFSRELHVLTHRKS